VGSLSLRKLPIIHLFFGLYGFLCFDSMAYSTLACVVVLRGRRLSAALKRTIIASRCTIMM